MNYCWLITIKMLGVTGLEEIVDVPNFNHSK